MNGIHLINIGVNLCFLFFELIFSKTMNAEGTLIYEISTDPEKDKKNNFTLRDHQV